MFTLWQPKIMIRQKGSSWNFRGTNLKTIQASENWDFYVVLNYKDGSQGLCWTMIQSVKHQHALKGAKTTIKSEGEKSDFGSLPWQV